MSKYPSFNIRAVCNSSTNGYIQNAFGINFPKGLILALCGLSFSKDGIANYLNNYNYNFGRALVARMMALCDLVITLIMLPIMITIYFIVGILGIFFVIILWIPYLFTRNDTRQSSIGFNTFFKFSLIGMLCFIPSIIIAIAYFIMSILQLLSPELTVFVFKVHEWSSPEFP